jgi:DNA-binding transcriptional LysR family regulator
MDIKQIKCFMAVYEDGSFTKAATRLNATQPGLSVQIALLEEELQTPLFERHARGVKATTAGEQLYKRGAELLRDTNTVVRDIQALSGVLNGSVAAGIPATIGNAVLVGALSEYVHKYPNVTVRIEEAFSHALLGMLQARELDFAIVTHAPSYPSLNFRQIYQDHFAIVSGPRVSLEAGKPIRLDTPPFFNIVVPSLNNGLHRLLDEPLQTGRISAARLMEIAGLHSIIEFVSKTEWIALLPLGGLRNQTARYRVTVNPIAGEPIQIRYFAAHVISQPLSAAAEAFIDLLQVRLAQFAAENLEIYG